MQMIFTARAAAADSQPKSARAYAEIRDAIITMKLSPGAVLQETEICAVLGVSRTPFREAVQRLAQEGLVSVVPGDGTFVSRITLREVIEGYIVRDSVEARTIRLAARNYDSAFDKDFDLLLFRQQEAAKRDDHDESFRVDDDFHRQLCLVAGFPRLWRTIRTATGQLDRVRRRAYQNERFHAEVLSEHAAIYSALRARDADEAARLMRLHLGDLLAVARDVTESHIGVTAEAGDIALIESLAPAPDAVSG